MAEWGKLKNATLDKNGYNHSFNSDGKKPPRVKLNVIGGLRMFSNKYYRMFIFTVIMPINGFLVYKCWWLGMLLIFMQLPWAYKWAER